MSNAYTIGSDYTRLSNGAMIIAELDAAPANTRIGVSACSPRQAGLIPVWVDLDGIPGWEQPEIDGAASTDLWWVTEHLASLQGLTALFDAVEPAIVTEADADLRVGYLAAIEEDGLGSLNIASLNIVIAPDAFKGSISAEGAAAALARGWLVERPQDMVVCLPMADGGEGTLDTVAAAVPSAVRVPIEVTGPDGRSLTAEWLSLPGGVALVELAATSGLLLLPRAPGSGELQLMPLAAHTAGTGQAIRAAIESGARQVHVAIGGSASSDGGAGLLVALGARLLDSEGREVPLGNDGLEQLHSIDLTGLVPLPEGGLSVWTDVRSPLLGPDGAVAVYGPQKGLVGDDALAAERRLTRFAQLLGGDAAQPGAGAAGGAGYGLAAIGATLVSGSSAVAEVVGLAHAVSAAGAVVTGEGAYDAQSAFGKVVSEVCAVASAAGVPRLLVAGRIDSDTGEFAEAVSLSELAGPDEPPMEHAEALLERAGRRLAAGQRIGT